jgi:2-C-methyl-D-erythritol 2,4-cyclodiphosphate synthase
MRVGHGVDVHRFSTTGPIVLLGEVVDDIRGVSATSDGDVAAHALADALLGAAALGDIGMVAPSDDPGSEDLDSMDLLRRVADSVREAGFAIGNVDVTIVAQTIRIAPHRDAMRHNVAVAAGIPLEQVSVKATTTDGLGFFGRDEGLGALATAVVEPQSE